jgi:hypothetical protein
MMNTSTQAASDPRSEADIDLGSPDAVERWSRALGTTEDALGGAVKAVGARVDRVKDYLGAGGAGDQEDA